MERVCVIKAMCMLLELTLSVPCTFYAITNEHDIEVNVGHHGKDRCKHIKGFNPTKKQSLSNSPISMTCLPPRGGLIWESSPSSTKNNVASKM
jgi:hypothetical protein